MNEANIRAAASLVVLIDLLVDLLPCKQNRTASHFSSSVLVVVVVVVVVVANRTDRVYRVARECVRVCYSWLLVGR